MDQVKISINVLVEFMGTLSLFMMMVSEESTEKLSVYCRGMIFGREGSDLLIRIATFIKQQEAKAIERNAERRHASANKPKKAAK